MFRVDEYPMVPGCCRMCQGTTLPAIDTELFGEQGIHDWRWYICRNCVQNMYLLIGGEDGHGVVGTRKFEAVERRLNEASDALASATALIDQQQAEIAALRRALKGDPGELAGSGVPDRDEPGGAERSGGNPLPGVEGGEGVDRDDRPSRPARRR